MRQKAILTLTVTVLIGFGLGLDLALGQESLSLQGPWKFRLDPENVGLREKWFEELLPDEVYLPGSLDEQGIGSPVPEIYMGKLTSETRYVGAAWYQKEVEIPKSWEDQRIELFLERAYWETTVYVDGVPTPTQNSLSTPDIHDLSGILSPGKHRITILVDNTVKINLGHTYGNMLWLHALTEETQTNWNGIIGKIELVGTPKVRIVDLQAYPDFGERSTRISITIENVTGNRKEGLLRLNGLPGDESEQELKFVLAGKDTVIDLQVPFESSPRYWDEFDPQLYRIKASLSTSAGEDRKELTFGLRDFRAVGHHFELNGRRIFLRGEVNCCIFPLTGYPPMTVDGWLKVLNTYREYGLNHVRFHSWCPPEAAFRAADSLGFIFQVEPPLWDGYGLVGSDPQRASFILKEAGLIIDTYGHHPSFCLMSLGNELGSGTDPYLAYLLDYLRNKDSRILYTSTTHPVGMERKDDYFTAAATPLGASRGINPFKDFNDRMEVLDRPMITHEVGQPAMYPNYDEMDKYTGHLKPRNLEVFRKSLEEKGMLDQAKDFQKASGSFAMELYKENIEAQLRTSDVAGFQLLGLQDFPGQGTAVVGVLDAFLESKELISPADWRKFCGPTVPLIRMPGFIYTADQAFKAEAEVIHYGPADLLRKTLQWQITNQKGKSLFSGTFPVRDLPTGTATPLGSIEADLSKIKNPEQFILRVFLPGTEISNSWKIWVYPVISAPEIPEEILVTRSFDDKARSTLKNGGRVLLIPEPETLDHVEKSRWDPVFWSYQLFNQPKGLGILCDPSHPALKEFPTTFHNDWQWRPLLDHSEALVLDQLPHDFKPILQVVPDFNTNLKMSLLMEARVGKGGLMVCNIDLLHPSEPPESNRQLMKSILDYMSSARFSPEYELDMEALEVLLKETPKNAHEEIILNPD